MPISSNVLYVIVAVAGKNTTGRPNRPSPCGHLRHRVCVAEGCVTRLPPESFLKLSAKLSCAKLSCAKLPLALALHVAFDHHLTTPSSRVGEP